MALTGTVMVGRVFISCGQRRGREQEITHQIQELLMETFQLESYVAINIQGFNDIMRITDELKRSDYYLFIDFLRRNACFLKRNTNNLPISLFTHQELALAHNIGFTEMIALREKGAPIDGFLRYIQSNPVEFDGDEDLLTKVEDLVRARGWERNYSRNLVLQEISPRYGPFVYADHSGMHAECVWHARIQNRRPDVAAVNTVCILDSISDGSTNQESHDRSNLKWARQIGYERTIFPLDYGLIDVISIRQDEEGLFLHSALDISPRDPIVNRSGKYILNFKVFSQNFPVLQFSIEVDYVYSLHTPIDWVNRTTVRAIPTVRL